MINSALRAGLVLPVNPLSRSLDRRLHYAVVASRRRLPAPHAIAGTVSKLSSISQVLPGDFKLPSQDFLCIDFAESQQ